MKYREEYNPLVIVGEWNKAIFVPKWVQEYIFQDPSLLVQYPIQDLSRASFKYTSDNISFNIFDQRLQFTASHYTDDNLVKIGETALSICRKLPHTPIVSFGINHVFECNLIELKGNNIFDNKISNLLKENGIEDLEATQINHTKKFADHSLCFRIKKIGETVIFDFNYDYPVESIEEFISKFDSNYIVNKKKESLHIIKLAFGLDLE